MTVLLVRHRPVSTMVFQIRKCLIDDFLDHYLPFVLAHESCKAQAQPPEHGAVMLVNAPGDSQQAQHLVLQNNIPLHDQLFSDINDHPSPHLVAHSLRSLTITWSPTPLCCSVPNIGAYQI